MKRFKKKCQYLLVWFQKWVKCPHFPGTLTHAIPTILISFKAHTQGQVNLTFLLWFLNTSSFQTTEQTFPTNWMKTTHTDFIPNIRQPPLQMYTAMSCLALDAGWLVSSQETKRKKKIRRLKDLLDFTCMIADKFSKDAKVKLILFRFFGIKSTSPLRLLKIYQQKKISVEKAGWIFIRSHLVQYFAKCSCVYELIFVK